MSLMLSQYDCVPRSWRHRRDECDRPYIRPTARNAAISSAVNTLERT
jgi:hypothetical protein